jgi:hypothetical protein
MTVTLLQLRTSAKQRSDNVNASFVSDAEWNGYIANSYQELYGLITTAFGNDYFTQTPSTGVTITTDGLTQFYALPADFFKLLGVDLQISGNQYWVTLKPFTFNERNAYNIVTSLTPTAGQVLRLFYVPRATVLSGDTDVVDGVNGWEDYIVADACIKALAKEESDVSVFVAQKQALLQRIESEAENRDAGMPARVSNTAGRTARGMRYRLNGPNLWLIGNGQPGWAPFGDWGSDDSIDSMGWF